MNFTQLNKQLGFGITNILTSSTFTSLHSTYIYVKLVRKRIYLYSNSKLYEICALKDNLNIK